MDTRFNFLFMTKPNDEKAFVPPGRDEAKPPFDKETVKSHGLSAGISSPQCKGASSAALIRALREPRYSHGKACAKTSSQNLEIKEN
ncbi:hypothetical protein [Alcaligenes sp. Marseille-Q7550]